MTIEQILARLQRHADVGPALFSITQEDARRICEHVASLKRPAPVSDEVVAERLEGMRFVALVDTPAEAALRTATARLAASQMVRFMPEGDDMLAEATYAHHDPTEKALRNFKTRIDAWLRRGYAVDR